MGLKVFTNSMVRKPVLCNEDRSDMEDYPVYFDHAGGYGSGKRRFMLYLSPSVPAPQNCCLYKMATSTLRVVFVFFFGISLCQSLFLVISF